MSLTINKTIPSALPAAQVHQASVIKKSSVDALQKENVGFPVIDGTIPDAGTPEIITPDEKQFFARMFPASSETIRSYTGYTPAGITSRVVLGAHIDQKG